MQQGTREGDGGTAERLREKLAAKQRAEGKRAVTDADRQRWELPAKFEHWTVPYNTDPDWPLDLADAVTTYRCRLAGQDGRDQRLHFRQRRPGGTR